MSNQADLTNAVLQKAGVIEAPPPAEASTEPVDSTLSLPPIRLPGRNVYLSEFARQLGQVCSTNGVYVRGDLPVYLDKRHNRLERLDPDTMITYAEKLAFLHRLEKSGEEFVKIKESMKKEHARSVLASTHFRDQQREIWRVNPVPCPVLRSNGSLDLLKPDSFDHETGILTLPSEFHYREMPVQEAVSFFANLTADFPMPGRDERGVSRALAVWIAALLTPFVLGMLEREDLVPSFVFAANKQGSGKSLCAKIILWALYGRPSALQFGKDEEELRKVLDTEAMANQPFLFFDNVKRALSSGSLDMWTTQPTWKGRRMQTQSGFEVPKQSVIIISANHPNPDKDADRRMLFCELFTEHADIQNRSFSRVINDAWLKRPEVRNDILSAAWSLVLHWDRSGRPRGPRSLGSFESWAALVGGICHAAGLPDPLDRSESVVAGDEDSKDMKELVRLLAHELMEKIRADEADEERPHDEEAAKAAEFEFDRVVEICEKSDLFVKKIERRDEKLTRSSRISMGRVLGNEAGQIWQVEGIGSVRFGRRGSKNWRSFVVELVEG